MIMRPFPYALLVVAATPIILLIAPPFALAGSADMRATCPATIPASSFTAAQPPEGWIGSTPNPLHLSAAGMMAGPPKFMLYLVPNKTTRSSQTFKFERGDRQRWLWCAYGPAQLSRRLDDAATSCTVTSRNLKQDGMAVLAVSVECR